MNKNDGDIDLRLALGSTNNRSQQSVKNLSGAGVNANSKIDMGFAASNSLSELVWSPNNGLSLKCADSGLADKKPFIHWNVGQSSKCLSISQSVRSRGSEDEKVDDKLKLAISPTTFHVDSKSGDKATLLRSTRSSPGPELGANHRFCDEANRKMGEEVRATGAICTDGSIKNDQDCDICILQNVQTADISHSSKENAGQDLTDETASPQFGGVINGEFIERSRCKKKRTAANSSSSANACLEVAVHSELHATKLSEAPVCTPIKSLSLQEPENEVASASEEVYKNKRRTPFPATPLKRLESSAENDLCHTAKGARSLNEMRLQADNSSPVERSPSNSGIRLYQEKGKEKALSAGDIYGRSSNEEDGSHETVESCNSARFVKGIKRQNSDDELISGSKRMKNQIQGGYGSAPVFGPRSSFMNWITNMVKGLSDSSKEEPSSSALALARSNDHVSKSPHENFTLSKAHGSANQNRGFKTMFQSLYCGSTSISNNGEKMVDYYTDKGKELMVDDKISLENLPGSSDSKIDNSSKQITVLDKENKPSRNFIRHSNKPRIVSADFPSTSCAGESGSAEIKTSNMLVCNRERRLLSPSDTIPKKVRSTSDDANLDIPSTSNMLEQGNPFSSLWITRLYTRRPKLETCHQINQEADQIFRLCQRDNSGCQMNDGFPAGHKTSLSRDFSPEKVHALEKEKQVFAANAEASVDLNSLSKLSPITKFKSSDGMASVFARRLDVLRHIIPSEIRNSSNCILTCFFCGRNGHDIQECPEIAETELKDLLVKVSSLDKEEESPRLCVRCFQLDHWAISCPLVSSSRHLPLDKIATFTSNSSAYSQQLSAGNAKRSSYQILGSFPGYLSSNATGSSSKRCRTSHKIPKGTASTSHFPMFNSIEAHNSVVRVEMFQAIRKLRLSRVDILRWMNSNASLSHLNGFFLRLRLGKLEAGLGRTGYYVARIMGDVKELVCHRSKKLIMVDVGGIQSSVESPYISNHDFLEDEIDAWWHKIKKAGGRIPSLGELNAKLNERGNLGL